MTLDDWKLSEYHRRRIAAALSLRKGVSLVRVLGQIERTARTYLRDYDANESKYKYIDLIERRSGRMALMVERRRHKSRGRIRREAMRAYVTVLVPIYENATGKRVGRVNNPYVDSNQEKPHPFLAACMKAVGKRYPSRIIQEVLEEFHLYV
jgi:hypothetical protein